MAKDTPDGRTQKYGPKNFRIELDGGDVIVRFSMADMAHNPDGSPCLAGTAKPPKSDGTSRGNRAENLVSTSNGFATIGTVKVSVNATSS